MMPILNEEETHVVGTRAVLDQDILPAGTSPVNIQQSLCRGLSGITVISTS